jgi:uncharacterized protein YigA (DUF484 family)
MINKDELKKINEAIAERFGHIEDGVLSARTIGELFEHLISGVEREFGIPFVWLSFVDSEDTEPILADVKKSDALKDRYAVVSRDLLSHIFGDSLKPVLANRDLTPFYRLMPARRKYFVRSIAVAPIVLHGTLIGTWNNADADENRYEPDMKTDFIQAMADLVSRKLARLMEAGAPHLQGGRHD